MGYPRIMGPGCAGGTSKMFNVNVNQITYGDKLQGLPPVTGTRRPYKVYRSKAGGNLPNRLRIYCINQLGGVGMVKNSQFAANADGLGPCPNRLNISYGFEGIYQSDLARSGWPPASQFGKQYAAVSRNLGAPLFDGFDTTFETTFDETGLGNGDNNAVCPSTHPYPYSGEISGQPDIKNAWCCDNYTDPSKNTCPKVNGKGGSHVKCDPNWKSCETYTSTCPASHPYPYNGKTAGQPSPEEVPQAWCCAEETDPTSGVCGGAHVKCDPDSKGVWVTCKEYDPPTPQSEFSLGTCYSELNPGFGIYLKEDGDLKKATYTMFGNGDPQIGSHAANMRKIVPGKNVINCSLAAPATWFNTDINRHYPAPPPPLPGQQDPDPTPHVDGNNGWCDNGFVRSMDDYQNPCRYPGNKDDPQCTDGSASDGYQGAFAVDVATGEPLAFKIWYGSGSDPESPPDPSNPNFLIGLVTDSCGGFCNKGIATNTNPLGSIYGIGEEGFDESGLDQVNGGIDCQWSITQTGHTGQGLSCDSSDPKLADTCFTNLDKLTNKDNDKTKWTLAKDMQADDVMTMFSKDWTREGSWRCPLAQLINTSNSKALDANSDFHDLKTPITSNSEYAKSARKAMVADPSNKDYTDSCSGRFANFDIRVPPGYDATSIYELWGVTVPIADEDGNADTAGEAWYQRLSWSELSKILEQSDKGKEQKANLLERAKYKDFGTNNS